MTDVLTLDPNHPDPDGIARAAAILREGGLVAFPTETVYGLGAHALDRNAVRRLFEVKGRPANDPVIVHVHHLGSLEALTDSVPPVVADLARRFWPGPLTIVLPRSLAVPDEVTAGLDTVAVRVPSHPIARALIEAAGVPVAAPSANLFSRPSPTRAEHVLQDLDGRIDLLIDGGPTSVGVESTVIDLTGVTPVILRPGAVTLEMIRTVLPDVRMESGAAHDATAGLKSPGLLEKHYSPRAPLTLYEGRPSSTTRRIGEDASRAVTSGRRVGIIAADNDQFGPAAACRIERLGPEHDLTRIAATLYHALRALDAAGVDVIFVRGFPDQSGLGMAVQDRLRRAAAGRIVHVEE